MNRTAGSKRQSSLNNLDNKHSKAYQNDKSIWGDIKYLIRR